MEITNILIIGRFQPFHNGHLNLFRWIEKNIGYNKKLHIGIGTSFGETNRNPWKYEVVEKMVRESLEIFLTAPMTIHEIPDINNARLYASHVRDITGLTAQNTVIVTGNDSIINSFNNEDFSENYMIIDVRNNGMDSDTEISGTKIREMFSEGGESWKWHVPWSVVQIIKEAQYVHSQ